MPPLSCHFTDTLQQSWQCVSPTASTLAPAVLYRPVLVHDALTAAQVGLLVVLGIFLAGMSFYLAHILGRPVDGD